jgi:diaminopimelate decarboxylase
MTATINDHGHLVVGGCDLVELAQIHGTPLYVLDEATFRWNCRAYRAALQTGYIGPSTAHYASKALLNSAVAQLVAQEELGLDVVSGGELYVVLRAGVPAARIHLHGNAKPRAELEQALAAEIGRIVVDTLDELRLLAELTTHRATPQSIMLRLSPEIAADTHAHIQTGHAGSKFGLPLDALDAAAALIQDAPGLRLSGLHAHLGSQLFDIAPFKRMIDVLLDCAAHLRAAFGITLDEISPGGGLGVPYTVDQSTPDLDAYAAALGHALESGCAARGLPLPRLVVEPGRSIVARAGVAIYTVVSRKGDAHPVSTRAGDVLPDGTRAGDGYAGAARRGEALTSDAVPVSDVNASPLQMPSPPSIPTSPPSIPTHPRYIHIDGGMADNIRPALYGARHTALLANQANAAATDVVHVAGRYCESGDVLLHNVALPAAAPGDVLAVAAVGAYTLSMASTYNLVPRPALLLVGNGAARVIQRRETYEDLVARDRL